MSSRKYYIQLFSIHGLVRADNMELGRDADTGGQVKYVVELAKALSQREDVERVELLTRLIADKAVSEDYAKPIKGYDEAVETAKALIEKYPNTIILPKDAAVERNGNRIECEFSEMKGDPFFDIGPKTIAEYVQTISDSAVVFANGPMGFFEKDPFALGTEKILDAIAACKGITVVGGGHMGSMAEKKQLDDKITHISTGGGATINFLTGKKLEVIAALEDAAKRM